MRIAIIGRSELLYQTALLLKKGGYEVPLIITAKEAPEYKVTADDFRRLASQWGAHFIQTAKINEVGCVEQIKSLNTIDLAVSINFSGVIAQSVIDLFPIGILNAHGGDLPRYRGNACQAWALLNEEKKIGLCIHKMIGGELDSGNIIVRNYYDAGLDTRVGEVYAWMESEIPLMVLDAVEKLRANPAYFLEEQSKNPKDALRCYPRNPADGKLNWVKDSRSILRLINASSEPFAGAFAFLNGNLIRIWRAFHYHDGEVYKAIPGQVAKIEPDQSVIVITGHGKIRITEISIEDGADRLLPGTVVKSIRQRFE